MPKNPDIARGRRDKERNLHAEVVECLEDPTYASPNVAAAPSPVIDLSPPVRCQRPFVRQENDVDEDRSRADQREPTSGELVAQITSMMKESNESSPPPPRRVSRRLHKRFAARDRSLVIRTFADKVVHHHECLMDHALAFPIPGIPLDVVREIILRYLSAKDVVNCVRALRGFKAMMAEDELWRRVFFNNSLNSKELRARWKRVRSKAYSWERRTLLMTRIWSINPRRRDVNRLEAIRRREELQKSDESNRIRALLKEKTRDWADVEEEFYVNRVSGRVYHGVQCPKVYDWGRILSDRKGRFAGCYRGPDPQYEKQFVQKSVALKKQYLCPHRQVGYRKALHAVACFDCKLCCYVGAVPRQVEKR